MKLANPVKPGRKTLTSLFIAVLLMYPAIKLIQTFSGTTTEKPESIKAIKDAYGKSDSNKTAASQPGADTAVLTADIKTEPGPFSAERLKQWAADGQKNYAAGKYYEAFSHLYKARELDDASVWLYLEHCYYFGEGTELNFKEAFTWYQKAGYAGSEAATYHLGLCYDLGRGVQADYDSAFKWYLKSANYGSGYGQEAVGQLYKKGKGTRQNAEQAFNGLKNLPMVITRMVRMPWVKCMKKGRMAYLKIQPWQSHYTRKLQSKIVSLQKII